MKPLIEIRNLSKTFGSEKAVNDVSLTIYDKEFLVLLGPSGCGKTTLLRMLGGFENPTIGDIYMDGQDLASLPPNKRPVNMVFQSYAVFPHLNVYDNIAYGLRIEGIGKTECERRVDEVLALVQLDSLAERYSHQLSGGQQQRVALARALVKRPRVLLLDEPLSALDAKLREAMQNELVKLQHTVGITFVVVTHDQGEALSMAERVAVMESGRIRQLDTPRNLYEAPQNRFVAGFVGRMNIFPARPLKNRRYAVQGLGELSIAAADENPAATFLAIRPEKLSIATEKPVGAGIHCCDARIENVAYYGGETVITVKTVAVSTAPGTTLTVAMPNSRRNAATLVAGQQTVVWWRAEDMIALEG